MHHGRPFGLGTQAGPGRELLQGRMDGGNFIENSTLQTGRVTRTRSNTGSAGSYRPTEDQSAVRHGEAHATCTGQTNGAAHARTCTGSSRARVTSAGTSASRGARTAAGRVRRGAAQRPSQEVGSSRGSTRTAGARRGRAGTPRELKDQTQPQVCSVAGTRRCRDSVRDESSIASRVPYLSSCTSQGLAAAGTQRSRHSKVAGSSGQQARVSENLQCSPG